MSSLVETVEQKQIDLSEQIANDARQKYAEILHRDVRGNATNDDADVLIAAMRVLGFDAERLGDDRELVCEFVERQKLIGEIPHRQQQRGAAMENLAQLKTDMKSMIEDGVRQVGATSNALQIATAARDFCERVERQRPDLFGV